MKTAKIAACGTTGCVFEGHVAHTYCFVPEVLIVDEKGSTRVAEADYVRGGWDVRNMRSNETTDGNRLFPDATKPVPDVSAEPVKEFLSRIRKLPATSAPTVR